MGTANSSGERDTSVKGDYKMSNAGIAAAVMGVLAVYLGIVIIASIIGFLIWVFKIVCNCLIINKGEGN